MVSLSMPTGRRTASSPVFYNISQAQETWLIGLPPPDPAQTTYAKRVNSYTVIGVRRIHAHPAMARNHSCVDIKQAAQSPIGPYTQRAPFV
jgi:hypothetical protein